jgi:hypothetical protein
MLAGASAGGAVLGGAAVPVARLAGLALPWEVTVAAGLAAGLLVGLGAALPPPGAGPLEPPGHDAPTPGPAVADLRTLHFAVQTTGRDPDRFEYRLRPRLCELAVDRLWLGHGLNWRDEADRPAARAVLGPGLRALLTAPPHSLRLTPRTLSDWLDELENL